MSKNTEYNKIIQFRYRGATLKVPSYSYFIPYATYFAGEYDFLSPRKSDIIIDAGANIGDYTLKIAKLVSKVVAIEPNIENLTFLESNTELLENVLIIKKAVGFTKGKVNFSSGGGVGSKVDSNGSGNVEMDTLDSICNELNIKPTLLKMDIEGYEGEALYGFRDHLKNIRKMVIEIHNESNKSACEKILTDLGFKFRYQNRSDVIKRTLKNVFSHPYSFIKYDKANNYYAIKIIIKYPFTKKSSIPSCGEIQGMYLMEAWK